jgi:hypothetical protein
VDEDDDVEQDQHDGDQKDHHEGGSENGHAGWVNCGKLAPKGDPASRLNRRKAREAVLSANGFHGHDGIGHSVLD